MTGGRVRVLELSSCEGGEGGAGREDCIGAFNESDAVVAFATAANFDFYISLSVELRMNAMRRDETRWKGRVAGGSRRRPFCCRKAVPIYCISSASIAKQKRRRKKHWSVIKLGT